MGFLENKQAIKVMNMLFGDENRAWHDSPLAGHFVFVQPKTIKPNLSSKNVIWRFSIRQRNVTSFNLYWIRNKQEK